jgi:hypothetical protein
MIGDSITHACPTSTGASSTERHHDPSCTSIRILIHVLLQIKIITMSELWHRTSQKARITVASEAQRPTEISQWKSSSNPLR